MADIIFISFVFFCPLNFECRSLLSTTFYTAFQFTNGLYVLLPLIVPPNPLRLLLILLPFSKWSWVNAQRDCIKAKVRGIRPFKVMVTTLGLKFWSPNFQTQPFFTFFKGSSPVPASSGSETFTIRKNGAVFRTPPLGLAPKALI